ncbi:MAG: hypothetical protein AAF596_08280, partial [Planctomycetota bacterium]
MRRDQQLDRKLAPERRATPGLCVLVAVLLGQASAASAQGEAAVDADSRLPALRNAESTVVRIIAKAEPSIVAVSRSRKVQGAARQNGF